MATERTRLLVDAGLSRRETFRRLKSIGEGADRLDAILISHEHTDHIAGMVSLARALNIPVYMNALTRQAIPLEFYDAVQDDPPVLPVLPVLPVPPPTPREAPAEGKPWQPVFDIFQAGQRFAIRDIDVEPYTIPHDAADPVAFCLSAEGIRIGVCLDLGYLPDSIKTHLRGCHCLVLESNHDLDMLKVGPYPWAVKQRVMGRTGHLSNNAVADFIVQDYDGGAAVLVLAHLSEQNNHPEIARLSAAMALESRSAAQTRLVISSQKAATEVFRF